MHARCKVITDTFCHVNSSLTPTCLCLSPCRGVYMKITAVAEQQTPLILISGEGDSFLVAHKTEVVYITYIPYDLPFASFVVFYIPSRFLFSFSWRSSL